MTLPLSPTAGLVAPASGQGRCSGSAMSPCEVAGVAVCAICGKREFRPARPGDAPEWRRACAGWVTSDGKELCSPACRDRFDVATKRLVVAVLGLAAASGVDIERPRPPPARRNR